MPHAVGTHRQLRSQPARGAGPDHNARPEYAAAMRAPPALGNPRRLLRVLECLFSGIRRPASVARFLDVDVRVVRAYLGQAAWIGLAREAPEPHLTALGLEFVMAPRQRADVMARVVADNTVLSRDADVDSIAKALLERGTSASPALARRDARAVKRLVAGAQHAKPNTAETQLSLVFPGPIAERGRGVGNEAADDSLDVYAMVLRGLLEHGELSLATLRGLLDEAGAADAGLGAYAALAVRRKDAMRRGESLVVTMGAIQRLQLAESAVSIALSDPDFRSWLEQVPVPPGESSRCHRWGRRLFGGQPVAEALPRLLFGRRLASFPMAGDAGEALPVPTGAFADAVALGPVALALPRTIAALDAGLAGVHQAWRGAVAAPNATHPPSLLDARVAVYGGLFAPGEAPPRNIPDLLTLRLRVVRNVPIITILTAAAELHRRKVLRLRERGTELWVELPGRDAVSMDDLLAAVARHRGWVVSRLPGRLPWQVAVNSAVKLGILNRCRNWVVLDETFFLRLASDPEHHELRDRLAATREAIEDSAARLRGIA